MIWRLILIVLLMNGMTFLSKLFLIHSKKKNDSNNIRSCQELPMVSLKDETLTSLQQKCIIHYVEEQG